MDAMPAAPAHAKDKPRRDALLPVLALILLGGLLEVWASWLQIGAVSGFPHLGHMTTGWILPVTAEAYWGCALWAWLVDPAGKVSRLFAMWSAAAVFVLSLLGQESDHLMQFAGRTVPPVGAAMLLTALPLTTIALGAILIHLRQRDSETAAEALMESAVAVERDALRTELETLAAEVAPLREALVTAQREAEQANAKAESLATKLAAQKPHRTRTKAPNAGRRKDPNAAPNGKPRTAPNAAPETEVPDDFDARAEALEIWLADPSISGKDLGARVGLGERWGQLRKTEFRKASAGSEPSEGRS
jgi:hypothetical protein